MEAHVVDLQSVLITSRSAAERARIHLELGQFALGANRLPQARRHLVEALTLDTSLDSARDLLDDIPAPEGPRPGLFGRLFSRG